MAPVGRVLLIVVTALMVTIVWIGGSIGLAQYTEDLCFEDADLHDYRGYTQTMQAWPPSLQRRLRGGQDQQGSTVDHRSLGLAITAWRYGLPLASAVGLAVAAVWSLRERADRTAGGM